MLAVRCAHYFLQYDGHLLLVDEVLCGREIILAVAVEDRGINGFDGRTQQLECVFALRGMGHHVGGVDAGKGLIVRVLQQTGRAHGNGTRHNVVEGFDVVEQALGECGFFKTTQDFFIGSIAQRNGIKVVALHELVEEVCADDNGFGDVYAEIVVFEFGISLDHCADESQATPLTSERPIADTGKVAVFVKSLFLVDGHNAGILHASVAHDAVHYQFSGFLHVAIFLHIHFFQNNSGGEHCPREEKTRKVIVRQVIAQRNVGNAFQVLLQVLQVANAHDFGFCLRIDDDKGTEAELFHDVLTQILRVALGVLAY